MRKVRTLSILVASGALALGAVGIAGATTGSDHASPKSTAAHARNAARHQHGHAFGHRTHDPSTTTSTTVPATTTTEVPSAPDVVHDAVGVVSTDGTSIQLMWGDEDHGTPEGITGYSIEFSTDGGVTWTQAPDPGLVNSMTLPYVGGEMFQIAAVNSTGTGAFNSFTIGGSGEDDHGAGDDQGQGATGSEENEQNSQGDEDAVGSAASGHVEIGGHLGEGHHGG